jgi:hypothetical protein
VIEERMDWSQAYFTCISKGGNLASISSQRDLEKIINFTTNFEKSINKFRRFLYWVGANDREKEGSWTWTDKNHQTFFWAPGEPNDHNR